MNDQQKAVLGVGIAEMFACKNQAIAPEVIKVWTNKIAQHVPASKLSELLAACDSIAINSEIKYPEIGNIIDLVRPSDAVLADQQFLNLQYLTAGNPAGQRPDDICLQVMALHGWDYTTLKGVNDFQFREASKEFKADYRRLIATLGRKTRWKSMPNASDHMQTLSGDKVAPQARLAGNTGE